MKKLLIGLVFSLMALAVSISTPATVSGDGVVHAIATSGTARLIIITAWPTNSATTCGSSAVSGCPWIGDSNISTSRGQFLVPGASVTLPNMSQEPGKSQTYALATVFYLVQSGDKLSITLVQ